jgi:hypothetical protein
MNKQNKKDLNFLREIRGHLFRGIDKRDPTEIQYALKMIDDWIDELEAARENG